MAHIMTVLGAIDASEMGLTLPHEHVLVDFGGAASAGPHRYDRDEVVKTMRPYVEDVAADGVKTIVECSPMYLARDPRVLKALSEQTGMRFVTNTGQYKEPFLPEETFRIGADELARQWVAEWNEGIEGTDVRPGFIKTAVNEEPLAEVQQKVMTAAAITSRETGLTIGTHTCKGIPALEIVSLLERNGVDPRKWIFIHAHQEEDFDLVRLVARAGSWIELDGIGGSSDTQILTPLLKLLDEGFDDQVLLSHDAGWYTVGEAGGGTPRPYTYLTRTFLPLLRRFGVDEATITKLTVTNPARAFALG
ncbi:MAG: phosphotriesterase family protein [Spirochaetota bacterium]